MGATSVFFNNSSNHLTIDKGVRQMDDARFSCTFQGRGNQRKDNKILVVRVVVVVVITIIEVMED